MISFSLGPCTVGVPYPGHVQFRWAALIELIMALWLASLKAEDLRSELARQGSLAIFSVPGWIHVVYRRPVVQVDDGEDGVEGEEPTIRIDDIYFLLFFLNVSLSFVIFSKLGLYFKRCSLIFPHSWPGITLDTGRGSVAVRAFTRGGFWGQRFRCLALPFGLTIYQPFPLFLLHNRSKGGHKAFQEIGQNRWYYRTIPVVDRRDRNKFGQRREFSSAEPRTSDAFFFRQQGKRWPDPSHLKHVGSRPVTMTGFSSYLDPNSWGRR